jgi:hypothetical protein
MTNRSLFTLAAFTLLLAGTATAQATRTWVSGVGDDANPCSRTAPCKTFAGAISKTAELGMINCLDPGGFGAVTITKSITIDCGGTFGSALVSGTNAINVAAGPGDIVTLRNIDIQGLATGLKAISFTSGNTLHVENVTIGGFTTSCIDVNVTGSVQLTVNNATLEECGANGISLFGSGAAVVTAAIKDTRILNGVNGVNAQNGSHVAIRDSTFYANTQGVTQTNLTSGGSIVGIFNSLVISNSTALKSIATGQIFAMGNSFFGNNLVFNPNGGVIGTGNDNQAALNVSNGVANAGTIPKI